MPGIRLSLYGVDSGKGKTSGMPVSEGRLHVDRGANRRGVEDLLNGLQSRWAAQRVSGNRSWRPRQFVLGELAAGGVVGGEFHQEAFEDIAR